MATASRIIDPKTGKPFAYGRPARRGHGRPQSRYDAAVTNEDNRRHWANADGLSARAANDPGVRSRLRNRARYEFANNGYAQGLTLSLADDMVGTGPSLQLLTEDQAVNRLVESAFAAWMEAVGFAELLHTAKQAKVRDGEAFFVLSSDPDLTLPDGSPSPVQLDLRPVECDQFATPAMFGVPGAASMSWVDGVELTARGKPAYYHLLREHPGDTFLTMTGQRADRIPASQVIHWFRRDRPGQCRGVPEVTASLPLFAQKRRYTLATLTAAETAADFSALLETDAPPDGEDVPDPFETLEIERNLMMTLPAGAKLAQLKAEQPTTQYQEFKRELLKEIGRPVSAPFNVTAGDSSPYNYSSARLDHQLYRSAVRVERGRCRRTVLERVYAEWLKEARLVGLVPEGVTAATPHAWNWPGFAAIDPLKESQADTEALANGTATLAGLLGEQGIDWEQHLRQRGRELELMRELGIAPATPTPADPNAPDQPADPNGNPAGSRLSEYLLRAEVRNG